MAQTLKTQVHRLLRSDDATPAGRWVDRFIVILILLNVAAVIAETVESVQARYGNALLVFERVSLVIFGVEYVLRLWTANEIPRFAHPVTGRLRWMATPYAVVDLLAIAPAFLPLADLRFVRVLRLLRLFKLGRYSEGFRILGAVFRAKRDELAMASFLVAVALVLSSSLMYYAERDAQPDKFSSILDAMWWGIVTLTTTGYGDVVPITVEGRIIAGASAVLGVLSIALPVGILAAGFTEELAHRRRGGGAAASTPARCPHCGEGLHPRP